MKEYRALIVGAGGWGRVWADTLHRSDRVEIAGWMDLRREVAAEAAAKLRLKKAYIGDDLGKALDATAPDFVVNLTVPSAHHEVAIAALDAGVPVLCEKPMADTMEHARAMVTASERSGALLVISQQRRYNANLPAIRRLVDEHIGPLELLTSDFFRRHPAGGFRDLMSSPLLQDMAIHTFDVARLISGADPVTVYCEHFNPSWSWYNAPANATAMFAMTDGLHYTYRGSWCNQGGDTAWEAAWRGNGPRGTVTWDGESAPVAELVGEPGVFPASITRVNGEPDLDMPAGLEGSLAAFLDALDTGARPMGECHDNIKSLAMVFAAVESAETGRRVDIASLIGGETLSA